MTERTYLEKEAHAAAELVSNLKAIGDDDLTADMVEGETEFMECLDCVLQNIVSDEVIVRGATEMANVLKSRSDDAKKRIANRKAAIETALLTSGLTGSIRRPAGTVTLKRNPPVLGDFEESEVPTQFFQPQDPKLDKKALLEAVKSGDLEGIPLKPESYSVQIRR